MRIPAIASLPATAALLAICSAAIALDEADLKEEKTNKFIIHYAIELPKGMPAGDPKEVPSEKKLGLFICFHGAGGQAPNEAHTVIGIMKRLKLLDGYVIIGAKSQAAAWDTKADYEPVSKLIEWAKKTFPINPRRVYTWGMSSGGGFSGSYGATHPDTIAASIIYGSGFWDIPAAKDPGRSEPDFYMVMGLNDDEQHKSSSRSTYARLKAMNYHIIYREVEGLPHSPIHPPTNDDAILWAVKLRHKLIPPADDEMAVLKPLAKVGAKDLVADEALFANIARIGGAHGGAVVAAALDNKDPAIRLLAAKACSAALFGDDTVAAAIKRLKDASPEVRKAVLEALAIAADYRFLAAQDTLAQIAIAKKWDLGERTQAVDGLAYAARLQLRGFYQDPPLFKALVTVMDDDAADLRSRAFAAVKTAIESTYGPEAERPARQSALAKWLEWLDKITPKSPETAKRP